ncbi:HAMP domain-containing sensor histidine kinase [Flammeovirgaceae bacterium SG7u.111]|nr:HAMP domain-containing sensor histidine kinase [Flammeovirgaceae bacterium SG7u.132]WPO34683.1 HAMP domain-containing sensor histidine kinase [Flammeovirgaceae bacterium SG7u.111]
MEIQELLKHEIQERVASEASLKSLTGKLETLVAQRTKNLEQTNNELQKEILERKAIELENFESKKQLQEQNLALRKVNDELDMFVYRTSHDLRAPLSSLLGLINISRGEYNSEESLGYYLDLMQKSVNKLDNYISDILDYSQNTRLRVRKNEINFHTLIEEILDGQKYQDPFQQVEIELDIQHPTAFFTDQKRLQIILNNIVSNAFRFRKTNEPHQKIQIKFHVKNNTAFIEISDNGQGIEQNRINKIFEMFYRGAENSKGSGLGLYIVKEAVNKIGGTIAVDSEVNHGSTFKLEIPSQKKVKAKVAVPA